MYEELVRWLRHCSKEHSGCGVCELSDSCVLQTRLLLQAADTIEELSKLADAIPHVCECCIGCELEKKDGGCDHAFVLSPKRAMQYLIKPCWIPVTEQLPDAYEDVLLKFISNQAVGFVDRDGCWGVYSGDGFYTEVAENESKPTHWAKKLLEPQKEET